MFRSKRFFSGKDIHIAIISKATKKEVTSKLISAKTRGGLCEPVEDMISFLSFCELIFRNMFGKISLNDFVVYVCAQENVVSSFHNATYCFNSNEKAQEEVLVFILKMFYHCRCNAKCQKYMERYLSKHHTQKKQKALRKDLN